MRTRNLKVGNVYFIRFEKSKFPKDVFYTGPAWLLEIDKTGELHTFIVPPSGEKSWFGSRDIKGEMEVQYNFKGQK